MARARGGGARSFWIDPRFLIGIGLVVVSVVGVWATIAASDETTDVYAARTALTVGDRIDDGDLVIAHVRLGDTAEKYLGTSAVPAEGLVVTRSVLAGELVPLTAVGEKGAENLTTVVVAVKGALPASVSEGAIVDLWSAPALEQSEFGPPAVLVPSASVARIEQSDGLIADGRSVDVELVVPRSKVALVLQAVAGGDALSVVPAG
ncbi:hypothetical protein WDJ51_01970 [Rathayibacter sp. YIM 133350]|uniref:hypothetical protein n=1 Tax=Rathayibacter sp. YIM 133350 TaxID=3131992 RepID=UPI00307F4F0D